MADYKPSGNFHSRLSVQTHMGPEKGVVDHRGPEFYKAEYERNSQRPKPERTNMNMNAVVPPKKKASKPRTVSRKKTQTTTDTKLQEANTKDLKSRNLK